MTTNDELLDHIAKLPEPMNKRLDGIEKAQQEQGKDLKSLKEAVDTVDLKVEAVHEYQKKAHDEIVNMLIDSNEVNGKELKKLEKRVERIEKHLNLPQRLYTRLCNWLEPEPLRPSRQGARHAHPTRTDR